MKNSRIIAFVAAGICICAVLLFVIMAPTSRKEPEQKPAWETHFDLAIQALNAKNYAEWDREANLVFEEGNHGKMPPQAAMDPEQRAIEQVLWFVPMPDRGETKTYTEALGDLARYYEEQKKLDEAERFYRKVLELEIAEKKANPKSSIYTHPSTLISFLQRRGKIKEALELQKLEIEEAEREAAKWPDQQRKAQVLMMKAKAFEIESKFAEAEDCLKKRVEVYANELSEENLARLRKENAKANIREGSRAGMFTLDRLNDLQEFYERRNDLAGQERTLKQVLSIHEKTLPENCNLLTYDWDTLADLYRKQKNYAKEVDALKQQIHFFEKADSWEQLSRAYEKLNKYDEAADALKKCIKLRESSPKSESSFWEASRYKSLAKLLDKSGKSEEAAQAREQAKKIEQTN